jgi:murein DD-endopeptidase MepM/ murein hydrolase activator NlpD
LKRQRRGKALPMVAMLAAFCLGMLVDSALRIYGPPKPANQDGRLQPDTIRGAQPGIGADPTKERNEASGVARTHIGPAATIGTTSLRLPIDGMDVDSIKSGFNQRRRDHPHEAVDILAPRNTPVRAVQRGTIAKLFLSKQGGRAIYQFDPSGRLCYYYAHLEGYTPDLKEGDTVSQGQVIGYVGTSGNAPPNTPHLHFAVFELDEDRSWWKGRAIDPYPLLTTDLDAETPARSRER